MIDLFAGLLCFTLGLVLAGTAWAWHELRRDHRRLGADHARQGRELDETRALVLELQATVKAQTDELYVLGKDADTAARVGGWKRYGA